MESPNDSSLEGQDRSSWSNINNNEHSTPGLAFVYSNVAHNAAGTSEHFKSRLESRRSRMYNTDGSVITKRLVTLADFVSLVAKSNVRGPLHFTEPNLQSRGDFVAEGGQWQVSPTTMASWMVLL